MDIARSLLPALPGIIFWSVVLSFIPNMLYCLMRESRAYKDEVANLRGIYIVVNEDQRRKEDRGYRRGIMLIYGACFFLFTIVSLWSWFKKGQASVGPFDMVSSTSIVLFWISVISYIPFIIYLAIKEPKKFREERARFRGMFIFYGIGLLIFSLIYSAYWLKTHQIPVGIRDLFSSFWIILGCAAVLSYLPILLYVYLKVLNPSKRIAIRPNIIFVIYSVCFLLFSGLYVYNWIADQNLLLGQHSFQEGRMP
ncbi:MAG TPA: hypothetical protein PL155_01985 [Candidatus Omnitrophota bacterium]|nr:hypothetical protein [Candidatus Omnitrophota bacterium]HPD84742.1 hypothetical protein [Candidatus Omnitrophota bacterium]HRZ03600.1 hypothetical protein [Candidatus Omnitrophota bacterium]